MTVKKTNKKKPTISIVGVVIIIFAGLMAYWLGQQNISRNGRLYPNRSKMCYQFAVDYLRNIENDPNYTDEKRELVIDIETEITDLCQLDLTVEAARDYRPTALEKYQE